MEQPTGSLVSATPYPMAGSVFGRMVRKRQNMRLALGAALLAGDVLSIMIAFAFGMGTASAGWTGPFGTGLRELIVLTHVVVAIAAGACAFQAVTSAIESVRRFLTAFLLAIGLVCIVIFFSEAGFLVSRVGMARTMLVALVLSAAFRVALCRLLDVRHRHWLMGELFIVDGGEMLPSFTGEVVDARALGLRPDITDPAHLSRIADVIDPYDRVVVSCIDSRLRNDWAQMLKCYRLTGEVVLTDGNPQGGIAIAQFHGHDTLVVSRGALSLSHRMQKRAMDIAISLAALLFLAPLMMIVALAIKLESRGPVLFSQPRMGRQNRQFLIFKFRSMRQEACDIHGSRSTGRDDDRVTRVGRIIRATSIDELPQLFNVLLGDMSVVGPRPHALGSLAGDKLFWEIDGAYWRRHALRPGITGLAQVRGFRGATVQQSDLINRLQSDLEYVNGWSLWRDFSILAATVRVIVHPQAY